MAQQNPPPPAPPGPGPAPSGPKPSTRVSFRQSVAELQSSLHRGRQRSRLWAASAFLLVLGAGAFLFLAYQIHSQYHEFRKVASGRMEIGIEHRRVVPSDLNIAYIYSEGAGHYRQPVRVRFADKGETFLVFSSKDGKLLGKRHLRRPDLDMNAISVKYQNKFGDTGNNVVMLYDSDKVARLVVSHTDQ